MKRLNDGRVIDWRKPNWCMFAFFAVLIALSEFGLLVVEGSLVLNGPLAGAIIGGASGTLNVITRVYANQIKSFEPTTDLEIHRANEQIKSISAGVNGLAVALAVGVLLSQASALSGPNFTVILFGFGMAVWINAGARNLLGLLK